MSISVGEQGSFTKTLTADDIYCFAGLSGDFNPIHMNAVERFDGKSVCHGLLVASLISAALGTCLPGPGTIYLEQQIRFVRPVFAGDTVTAKVKITDLCEGRSGQIIKLETDVWNQDDVRVISGHATVLFPKKKNKVIDSYKL